MIEAHRIRIQNAGIEIITRVTDSVSNIKSDRDALEQVVLNLIDNVIKYASEGGKIMFIVEDSSRGFMDLKICDRGKGIAVAHQKRIFEKFYRVDNSLTSSQPGSGLGLSIAKKMIQGLGGDLLYEDMKPGSCFIVRIRKNG